MKTLLLLLLPLYLMAQTLHVGDRVSPVTLLSQHDKEFTLVQNGIWVITWEKTGTSTANKFFQKEAPHKNVQLIVDLSQAPSGILSLFIMPNMRRYSHPILLSFDEAYNRTLPYKEGFITVLYIQNKVIQKIKFVQTQKQLKKALE